MRAIIILVHQELEGRFERSLPPEHRIRARRQTDPYVSEFIVEGPMLPVVVDDDYVRGDLQMTMHTDEQACELRLEACWRFWLPDQVGMSESWEVGRWSSVAEMMEFMR